MQSTDQILLELAAVAAGLHEYEYNNGQTNAYYANSLFYMTKPRSHTPWNPLTDGGDAQELAARLRINVLWQDNWVMAYCGDVSVREYDLTDPAAAMRRAIVRAAAELGRALKEAA